VTGYLTDKPWQVRFWAKVAVLEDPTACWEWQASCRRNGYGQIWYQGKVLLSAHRVAYEITFGPLQGGLVLRHQCDNPRCCNPNHLLAGDQAANMRDRRVRARDSLSPTRKGNISL